VSTEEAVHGGRRETLAVLPFEPFGDLDQRDVRRLLHHRQDRRTKRFDPA
jgi:hypothetical protein